MTKERKIACLLLTTIFLTLGCRQEAEETVSYSSSSSEVPDTSVSSASLEENTSEGSTSGSYENREETRNMTIEINGQIYNVQLEDNSSVRALLDLLEEGPLELHLKENGGMEKYGPVGTDLPDNDQAISVHPGDIVLYQNHYLCLYYGENHYNFTKIGHIEGISEEELVHLVGSGDIDVTLRLS